MTQVIIHPSETGGVTLVIPFIGCGISIEEIARKDTPAGLPYHIVDSSQVPEDRTFYHAWEADFSNPTGYGIGAEAWFAEQKSKEQA